MIWGVVQLYEGPKHQKAGEKKYTLHQRCSGIGKKDRRSNLDVNEAGKSIFEGSRAIG